MKHSIDKSKLMKLAWRIARRAAVNFGGVFWRKYHKVSDFFDESLRQAWDMLKYDVNIEKTLKSCTRIMIDYVQKFSPTTFRMFKTQENDIGIDSPRHYIDLETVNVLKREFYCDDPRLIPLMESGAKCSIAETSIGWLIDFHKIKSHMELNSHEVFRVRDYLAG